jgi:hypothetical protein
VNLSIWRSVRGTDRSRNQVANRWAVHPIPSQKASKPLWHKHFPPRIGAIANRIISSFARLGGFVIRSPLRTLSALFLGSSAVEHSTVNRMVAGSNPARGAKHFQRYGLRHSGYRDHASAISAESAWSIFIITRTPPGRRCWDRSCAAPSRHRSPSQSGFHWRKAGSRWRACRIFCLGSPRLELTRRHRCNSSTYGQYRVGRQDPSGRM